ncbi:MAG: sulfatase-like hydrolase/transferase [bacterium]|nr:sulfatase-like hydrolase/transferase [bacterium]
MTHEDNRPNILFLFTDQQRPDWFSMNPEIPVRTPHLQALSERGIWFTQAICPSPVCAPCRACLASGLEYDHCGVWANDTDFPPNLSTYHRRLRDEAGYHVMNCGKFHTGNNQAGTPPQFAAGIDGRALPDKWGFSDSLLNAGKNQATILMRHQGTPQDAYMAYLYAQGLAEMHIDDYRHRSAEDVWTATFPTPLPDEAYFDNWIAQNGLQLLSSAPTDRPWYLEVNFQNPHHPWDITERMHALYRDPDINFPAPMHSDLNVSPEVHQEVRRNYAAMVEHLDECVGRFIAALEARDELDRTLIVFSSDHGEMLGDYGQWQKLSPLQASVGVPLVIAGAGVKSQGACDLPTTILDLHATFLDYAGLAPSDKIDSRSMRPLLNREQEAHRRVVYSGLSAWRMAFDGRYKLVKGYDPQKRRGGNDWEPMHVPTEEAQSLQTEREPILYEVHNNEYQNTADHHPEVVADLSRHLESLAGP